MDKIVVTGGLGFIGSHTVVELQNEGYEVVKGKHIIDRYLKDDLWETEKVDEMYNQATFLLSKIVTPLIITLHFVVKCSTGTSFLMF
jgi:nucleoside-diphosphate-sugar epimerase